MRKTSYVLLIPSFLLSCIVSNKTDSITVYPAKGLTKLEQLFLLPSDSAMDFYDLSNDSIMNFPDLSAYSIKSLDLSHNLLDTIKPNFLPQKLEKLNLSHNLYCGVLIERSLIPFLKNLDISHNALNRIDIATPLHRIDLSYNDLASIDIYNKNIQYLNISYNSDLTERMDFNPHRIDTLIREGVAKGKRLLGPFEGSIVY